MIYNENIKRVCSFYVSDWHFVTMLLPHINEEINEKVKFATILQTDEKTYMTTLLEKLKIENKDKVLKINWNKTVLNESNIKELLKNFSDEIEIIVKGDINFIKQANDEIIKNITNQKVKIINCYNINEDKEKIAEILAKHDMVLNTSGEHEKEKYIQNIKIANA